MLIFVPAGLIHRKRFLDMILNTKKTMIFSCAQYLFVLLGKQLLRIFIGYLGHLPACQKQLLPTALLGAMQIPQKLFKP